MSPHTKPKIVGETQRRVDAPGKVTGDTPFGGDLAGPEVLCAGVIRSPHPHCEVKSVSVDAARNRDGVIAVFTDEDIEGTNRHGLIRRDQEVFVTGRARFLGDALGLVVAATPKVLANALEEIEIDYTPLPIIGTMDDALAENAFPIHPEGNVLASQLIRTGDADTALKESDAVIQSTFKTQCVDHAFLDREAGIAYLEEDGMLTIHAAGQWIHEERRLVALALGLPQERVRIIQPATGGAFGGREDISIQIYLGLAVLKLQRPIRIEYSRKESMLARHKRHPIRVHYTLGATSDGQLTAARVKIESDEGAYASTGPAVLRKAVSHCTGPYRVPNIACDGVAVFTNNNPTGAMRGFGACQLALAYETAILELAQRLEIDPVALKRRNLLQDGEGVTTTQKIPVVGALHCMELALERIGWDKRHYETNKPYLRRGYGVSSICFGLGYGDGFPDASRARVRFADDGMLEVLTAGVDFGQGLHTLAGQIAANELGLALNQVRVIASDTLLTPESGSSSATRQTVFTGNAVRLAASEVKRQILDIAAAYTGLHWDDLELRNRMAIGKEDAKICLPLGQAVRLGRERGYSLDVESCYQPRTVAPEAGTGKSPRAFLTYMFASHAAEVLVDIETGEVRVKRIVAVHDVGKAINPQQVEGQIEGGVMQGLGMALMEEVITRDGQMLNANFTDYIIPTIVDTPDIEAVIVEREDPEGPYGARGVGEPALIGTPPAILAAISDAIGTVVNETPATAERVWQAIQRKKAQAI
ncbi:MAG: xanthine dehydrogenase family protein molybdopterin-binding subunit [Deltaproteobacteria bacterium]|nr:xanthine dehydrogenase family protein molybdopterin-binding subunit [Deltaproteobacteria bacterium]